MYKNTHARVVCEVILTAVVGLVAIVGGAYLLMVTSHSLFGGFPAGLIGKIAGLGMAAWIGFCTFLYREGGWRG